MPAERILVIDAGTSALRAIAVDRAGHVTRIASEAWPMFVPADAAPFGREFDVAATRRLAHALVARSSKSGGVAAIAFTGQREGIAFLDDKGDALFASPNIDARAATQGMAIDAAHADDVYRTTGHLPSLMQVSAKLAWLREHRPLVAGGIARALPLADWLADLAGGDGASSRSLAAENGLLDIASGNVCAPLLARFGIAESIAGRVRREGLAGEAGVPIVLAGADTQCGLAGMGAIADGDVGVTAGWSAPLQMVTATPIFDDQQRTWTSVHVVPERWILESNAGETGRAWEWSCAMLGVTAEDGSALAGNAARGAGDVMTVLGPRAMRAASMNAGVGAITLPLPLVMSAPDRGQVLRSVLESIAYAVRANLEQMEGIRGRHVERVRLGGGMSGSAVFVQIAADVVERPVEVAASPETSALGAAALAAAAIGWQPSLEAAVEAMCGGRRIVEPDLRASSEYDDHYDRWCAMADGMELMGSA